MNLEYKIVNKDSYSQVVDLIRNSFNLNLSYNSFDFSNDVFFYGGFILNELVSVAMVQVLNDPIKGEKGYYVNYVCVSKDYQGKGYGKELMNNIISNGYNDNVEYIMLTSNKSRIIARNMYSQLEFAIKDTDLFIKNL